MQEDNKAYKEMERIVALSIKYKDNLKFIQLDEVLSFILEKLGYKRYTYIPKVYDTEDLEQLVSLTRQFIKKYSISIEMFIYRYQYVYQQSKVKGFQADLNQTVIKEG